MNNLKNTLEEGDKIEVYRNLHKKCFSVKHKGKVVGYLQDSEQLSLTNVKFVVQPAGRAKVLREKKKNVHAYASGYVCQLEDLPIIPERINAVTYNPYKHETFVYVDNGKPCLTANFVEMQVVNKKPIVEGIWK